MTTPAAQPATTKPASNKLPAKLPRRSQPKEARRLARLVAVQALYQADIMKQSAVLVLKEFEAHRLTPSKGHHYLFDLETGEVIGTVDLVLMRDIVALALQHQNSLEEMLAQNLPADWKLERIERQIRVVLLAGLAEIIYQPETAMPVIISNYIDVAHAFYQGKEPGMINAILDKIGRAVRA